MLIGTRVPIHQNGADFVVRDVIATLITKSAGGD